MSVDTILHEKRPDFKAFWQYLCAKQGLQKGVLFHRAVFRQKTPADIESRRFLCYDHLATGGAPCSFFGVRDTPQKEMKGEGKMPDDWIRRMIRAVIESFSIDEGKKADILRALHQKKAEEDRS